MESPAKRQRVGPPLEDGLVIMLLDIEEESAGRFCLWGRTADGQTVLVQVILTVLKRLHGCSRVWLQPRADAASYTAAGAGGAVNQFSAWSQSSHGLVWPSALLPTPKPARSVP